MSHWFDRLATWSSEDSDAGEERLLTRREAVGAAAAGAATVSVLSSPLLAEASNRLFKESAACACWREALKENNKVTGQLLDNLIYTPSAAVTPLNAAIFTIAYTGLNLGTVAKGISCGSCDNDKVPSGQKPPPNFQPCTQRGGVRLRGDQCGGGGGNAEPGQPTCAPPTHACAGGFCCFGSDLCCGGGCCCIVEVGCGCCG